MLLGMAARVLHPGRCAGADRELALPLLFMHDLPFWVGALGLAAVFSAEVSAADAVLFMLSTSLSQDLYKRFVNPAATDRAGAARRARRRRSSAASPRVIVALLSKSVIDALSLFYTLVGVSLFVPVVAGLYLRRASAPDALAAIAGGIVDGRRGRRSGTAAGRSASSRRRCWVSRPDGARGARLASAAGVADGRPRDGERVTATACSI